MYSNIDKSSFRFRANDKIGYENTEYKVEEAIWSVSQDEAKYILVDRYGDICRENRKFVDEFAEKIDVSCPNCCTVTSGTVYCKNENCRVDRYGVFENQGGQI